MNKTIDINIFQNISETGQIFTAFGYVLSVNRGILLLAPWERISGDLSRLVHACPVPYQEVLLSIETQTNKTLQLRNEIYSDFTHQMVNAIGGQWFYVALDCLRAILFEHESGLKVVLANELALKKEGLNNDAQ